MSTAESGDFNTIACGCPDEAGNIATPSPTPGVVEETVAPVPAVTEVPTPALVTPTMAPIPEEPGLTPDATNQVRAAELSCSQRRLVASTFGWLES